MNDRRWKRPADRDETERLLDATRRGSAAPDTADADPLARLLSAAAAPARPGELAGEDAALAAFRAARAAPPAPAPARRSRRRRFTAGAVAWGAGIAVTATAGAAFAAVTLDGPDAAAPPRRPATSAPAPTGADRGESTGSGGTPTDAGPSRSAVPNTGAGVGRQTPEQRTEQLRGLCRAYLAKPPAQRDEALDTPAFRALVVAAGGRGRVEDFCRALAPGAEPEAAKKTKPSSAPSARPTPGPRG